MRHTQRNEVFSANTWYAVSNLQREQRAGSPETWVSGCPFGYFWDNGQKYLVPAGTKLPFPQGSLRNENSPQGEPRKTITIYTDGACSGNPGPGGWGAILEWQGHQKELSGGEAQTTNNRMELTAVLTALAILKEPCIVELYSDSKYVVDAIEKGWLYGWQKKGWIKADKKPVLNVDLWQQLLPLLARHDVRLHWVKGHAENEKNNRCDQLAVAESKKFR